MNTVIFYNDFNFTMPAAPGDAATTLAMTPAGLYFGIMQPVTAGPSNVLPISGCSKESNVQILRYRYSFIGPKGLRPAVLNSISGLFISFLRAPQWSPGVVGDQYLPFIQSEEWIDLDQLVSVVPGQDPLMSPTFNPSRVDVDTRNLQSLYYGSEAILRLEVECNCAIDI